MTSVIEQETADARSHALRTLLAQPLIDRRAGEDFIRIVRHATWLQRWFDEKCGWVLVIDARRGFARLRKITAMPDRSRGAINRVGRSFNRRRYTLLCVAAAALSGTARPQISLQDLVERVIALTTDNDHVSAFAPTRRDERIALVDAIVRLIDFGVLAVVEERGDYTETLAANVLYDVDDRRLGHLIAAPRPPSLSTSLANMLHEDRYGPWLEGVGDSGSAIVPDNSGPPTALERARSLSAVGIPTVSDEQIRRRSRHRLMRRLLDDPVVYFNDLDESERSYLTTTIGAIGSWVREAGFVLERRAEGVALIDPSQIATDIHFPEGNDVIKFAALILLNSLVPETVPDGAVRHLHSSVRRIVAEKLSANPTWARAYQDDFGAKRLTDAAVDVLVGLRLAISDPNGIDLLPAAGRYLPQLGESTRVSILRAEPDLL